MSQSEKAKASSKMNVMINDIICFSFSNFKLSLTIKGNSTFSIVAITFIDHYYKSIEKSVVTFHMNPVISVYIIKWK